MANPDAKHYLDHDIFTYITSLPDPEKPKATATFRPVTLDVGDTVFYSKGFAVLENVRSHRDIPQMDFGPDDSASVATIKLYSKTSSIYTVEPAVINYKNEIYSEPDTIIQESLVLQVQEVNGQQVTLGLKESHDVMQYVTLKAYKFPWINLLWLGTIIMVIGFLISMAWRIQNNKQKKLLVKSKSRVVSGKEPVG